MVAVTETLRDSVTQTPEWRSEKLLFIMANKHWINTSESYLDIGKNGRIAPSVESDAVSSVLYVLWVRLKVDAHRAVTRLWDDQKAVFVQIAVLHA